MQISSNMGNITGYRTSDNFQLSFNQEAVINKLHGTGKIYSENYIFGRYPDVRLAITQVLLDGTNCVIVNESRLNMDNAGNMSNEIANRLVKHSAAVVHTSDNFTSFVVQRKIPGFAFLFDPKTDLLVLSMEQFNHKVLQGSIFLLRILKIFHAGVSHVLMKGYFSNDAAGNCSCACTVYPRGMEHTPKDSTIIGTYENFFRKMDSLGMPHGLQVMDMVSLVPKAEKFIENNCGSFRLGDLLKVKNWKFWERQE